MTNTDGTSNGFESSNAKKYLFIYFVIINYIVYDGYSITLITVIKFVRFQRTLSISYITGLVQYNAVCRPQFVDRIISRRFRGRFKTTVLATA